jgi:uncharacterized membrane protein YccC
MRFRRATHTIRSATSFAGTRPAYAAGVRASFATVIPLAIGMLSSHAEAGTWMSIGGFNGALSDRGGSYRSRALTMLALLPAGALAAFLGTLVSGHFVIAMLVTFVVAFACSVLRVWGNSGISVGLASLTVYVVALAIPSGTPVADSLSRAGFVVLGGLWAMGLALVLWPLRPYRPARLAIAACYSALSDYIEQVAESVQAQHTTEWPIQSTPPSISSVRTSLENATEVLVQLRRGRPGKVDRGERLLVLAELADQLFGHVVALGDTLASLRGSNRIDALSEHSHAVLHEIAATSRAIAAGVLEETDPAPIAVTWSGESLREAMRAYPPSEVDPQYEQAALILDRAAQFAASATVSIEALNGGTPDAGALAAARPSRVPAAEEVPEEHAFREALRATMSPGSLIVRFALRVAVVSTVAVALTELLDIKRGFWITITAIVILQPYAGFTLTRAVQRVLGTVLGALLAAALGAFFHDPRAILVIATIFVACCVALLPLNYAAFSVFLTPTFVLLAEASAGDWSLASTRVLNTLLGGALALLGSRLLWPSPESLRFPSYAAAALRANRAYLDAVVDGFDDTSAVAGESMRAARRAIGLATVNAEESLQRALADALGDERKLATALTVLAYTRRFTASVAALGIARHSADGTTRAELQPFREAADATLEDLASALHEMRPPLALPPLSQRVSSSRLSPVVRPRVDRLARQITTLHDAVARMTGA